MTNDTRYRLRLMVGLPIVGAYFLSGLYMAEISKEPHDGWFWLWMGINMSLVILMVLSQNFFPAQFPDLRRKRRRN